MAFPLLASALGVAILDSMKRILFVSITLFSSILFLSACLPKGTTPPAASPSASVEKSGTTTLQGTLQVQGKTAILRTATGTVALESYDVSFTPFDGKSVTVTGKYSGDTLFVSQIQ